MRDTLTKSRFRETHQNAAKTLDLHIRRFRYDDGDYKAAVAIENANYPDQPQSVESWRFADANREPQYLFRRYAGELDGRVVATVAMGHTIWTYRPGKYFMFIAVDPRFQRRGIGTAIYGYLLDELAPLEPTKLVAFAREDHEGSMRFLRKRGFQPALRAPKSRLDTALFDPAPFQYKVQRVLDSGIAIKTMAQLRQEDPDWKQKIYDLEWECLQDVPSTDPFTRRSFEQFERTTLRNPALLPEAWYIAVDGDRYVGLSLLWRNLATDQLLETGLTGVVRSHRRRGIATALKLQAIRYAQEHDNAMIETDNEENNPMLQLNIQLGFRPQPAFVDFEKLLMPGV